MFWVIFRWGGRTKKNSRSKCIYITQLHQEQNTLKCPRILLYQFGNHLPIIARPPRCCLSLLRNVMLSHHLANQSNMMDEILQIVKVYPIQSLSRDSKVFIDPKWYKVSSMKSADPLIHCRYMGTQNCVWSIFKTTWFMQLAPPSNDCKFTNDQNRKQNKCVASDHDVVFFALTCCTVIKKQNNSDLDPAFLIVTGGTHF